jgi:hypothetical protein
VRSSFDGQIGRKPRSIAFGQNFGAFLDCAASRPGRGPKAASHSKLDSALGSHPCVALSSCKFLHCTAVAENRQSKPIHSGRKQR